MSLLNSLKRDSVVQAKSFRGTEQNVYIKVCSYISQALIYAFKMNNLRALTWPKTLKFRTRKSMKKQAFLRLFKCLILGALDLIQ